MRILIAAGIFPPDIGGPATYAKRIAEELALRGNEVGVLTYTDNKFPISDLRSPIYRILRGRFKLFTYLNYFLAVLKYGCRADIIYVQDSVSAGLPVVFANLFLRKRLVLKIVGDYAWERGGNKNAPILDEFYPFNPEKHSFIILVLRTIQTWVAESANAIIVPSEYLKKNVSKGWGIEEEKISVVYNSISDLRFSILDLTRDENVIISAGRLVLWKGFGALIELMPELLKENPEFKLKIIGDGPEEEKLKELAKSMGVSDKVIFTGRLPHENSLQELASAGMFVLNTGYEGLSHQLLEALCVKIPVITTNIGGNPEVVIDNENGLLVNYNDKFALKDTILKLWKDENLKNKFRENGEKILKEKFGFDFLRITNETLKVLSPKGMRVLMVSLDETILNPNSLAAERMREYGNICDDLKIVVLNSGERKEKIKLSERVLAYPTNSPNKILAVWDGFFIGWRITKDFKSSIITTQDPFRTGLIGWVLSKISGAGFNVQIHGDFYGSDYWNKNLFGKMKNIFGGFIIKRAGSVRTVSASMANSLEKLKLFEEPVIVPVLADIEEIKNAEPKFNLHEKFPGKGPIVLSVGRLEKEKNHIFLLRMMKELLKEMPSAFLVIVGDGSLRGYLEGQAKELGVDKSVSFESWQDDLVSYYKTCDIYALPSLTESYGATILEASAAGVPILMASQVGLAKEYLENDKSVIIRENEKDFAESLINLSKNLEMQKEIIREAEKIFDKLYSKNNVLDLIRYSWQLAERKNKILIITQKVDKNDQILGFFHNWLLEFAENTKQVFVIANEVGEYDLPANVKVFSLGKENGAGKLARYARFMNLSRKLVPRCGGIFAHMCPEYVIAVSPIAKIFGKKILLWFVHKSKDVKLWFAEKLSDGIFTVAKESCALNSKRVHMVGHGINTEIFKKEFASSEAEEFKIISVGRISPIKDYKTLVEAIDILVKKGMKSVKITIVGEAYLESDKAYKAELLKLIDEKGIKEYVVMLGSKTQNELPELYNSHNLLVNLCPTGGVDKVVLEAGACELPSLVANEAFREFLGNDLMFKHGDATDLAEKIMSAQKLDLPAIGRGLGEKVVAEHNLNKLIVKIIGFYQNK